MRGEFIAQGNRWGNGEPNSLRMRLGLRGEGLPVLDNCRAAIDCGYQITSAGLNIGDRVAPPSRTLDFGRTPGRSDMHLGTITPGDRTKADRALEENTARLSADERDVIRAWLDVLFDLVTRGTTSWPASLPSMTKLQVFTGVRGSGAPLLSLLARLTPDLVQAIDLGAVIPEGRPPKPYLRWLPPIVAPNVAEARKELEYFSRRLPREVGPLLTSAIQLAQTLFGQKSSARTARLRSLGEDQLGVEAISWLQSCSYRPLEELVCNDDDFGELLRDLKAS